MRNALLILCFLLACGGVDGQTVKPKGALTFLKMYMPPAKRDTVWRAGRIVKPGSWFEQHAWCQTDIPDSALKRMKAVYKDKYIKIPLKQLCYLKLLHYNKTGQIQLGEMVCNKSVAGKLIKIFKALYTNKYPIERMVLVDNYNADDEKSMAANNTSCFNYRVVAGTTALSKHSLGKAVDINPLYNPCVKKGTVSPASGKAYANRSLQGTPFPLITTTDLCYRLFRQYGATWGGAWRSLKDYQHFEFP